MTAAGFLALAPVPHKGFPTPFETLADKITTPLRKRRWGIDGKMIGKLQPMLPQIAV
jgi:hypothetical protein